MDFIFLKNLLKTNKRRIYERPYMAPQSLKYLICGPLQKSLPAPGLNQCFLDLILQLNHLDHICVLSEVLLKFYILFMRENVFKKANQYHCHKWEVAH